MGLILSSIQGLARKLWRIHLESEESRPLLLGDEALERQEETPRRPPNRTRHAIYPQQSREEWFRTRRRVVVWHISHWCDEWLAPPIWKLRYCMDDTDPPQLEEIYAPLEKGHIRLLRISVDVEGELSCHLRHTELIGNSLPPYTAISYTWKEDEWYWYGPLASKTTPIHLDGVWLPLASKIVHILKAVYEQGWHTIWIDALCINQPDLIERGHQVKIMQSIYLKAYQTVVFLGNPSYNTDLVFDMMLEHSHVNPAQDFFTPTVEDVEHGSSLEPHTLLTDVSRTIQHHGKTFSYDRGWLRRSFNDNVEAGVSELLRDPYWNRTWILQELATPDVPTYILCGQQKIHLEAFEMLLEHFSLKNTSTLNSRYAQRLRRISDIRKGGLQGNVLNVMQSTRSCQASDLRDAIYAKLGLVRNPHLLVGTPTYEAPVAQVFVDFAIAYILATSDTYIICFGEKTALGLPSWVVDWSQKSDRRPLCDLPLQSKPLLTLQDGDVTFSDGGNVLCIAGVYLASICDPLPIKCSQRTAETPPPNATSSKGLFSQLTITDRMRSVVDVLLAGKDMDARQMDNFVKAFVLRARILDRNFRKDLAIPSNRGSGGLNFNAWYAANRTVEMAGTTLSQLAADYSQSHGLEKNRRLAASDLQNFNTLAALLITTTTQRRIAMSGDGWPMLIPDAADDSDWICIVAGCPVPVVLRKRDEHYVVVGECYIPPEMTKGLSHEVDRSGVRMFSIR